MPSVTYMNQSAPFWDFIASLEQQGSQHPLFPQNRNNENQNEHEHGEDHEDHRGPPPFGPWGWGQFFGGGRGMPHRDPPPHHHNEEVGEKNEEKDVDVEGERNENNDNGEGPSAVSGSDNEAHPYCRGRHGRCGGRRGRCGPGGPGGRGGWGSSHGPPHHDGPHHGGPHHGPPHHGGPRHGGRGRWGSWGRGGFGGFGFGGGLDPSNFAAIWNQFNENHPSNKKDNADNEDHNPDADVFDTESAFVVHVSLPGAKKDDVGVNWDAEKSELSVAGVIYRPGDEDFLKTLAMNERKVGAFERKIRLGTRANPAQIDAEAITAKLEDGILRVEVPKLDAGYVEIKKVDIE